MSETLRIRVINLQEGRYWYDCPICHEHKRNDHAVAWYEEAIAVQPGECVPGTTDETCGMLVCKECHDKVYSIQEAHL